MPKSLFQHIFFILLLLCSASNMPTNASSQPLAMQPEYGVQEVTTEFATDDQAVLEQLFKQVQDQLQSFDSLLEEMAFNIATNSSLKALNCKETSKSLIEMRTLIGGFRTTREQVLIDLHLINQMSLILQEFVKHIETEITKKNTRSIASFDLNALAALRNQEPVTLESVSMGLAKNYALLEKLGHITDNLGLHWYNKVWRLHKKYIVDTVKAVWLPVAALGSAAFGTWALWYYLGGENPAWFRRMFGWPSYLTKSGIVNTQDLHRAPSQHIQQATQPGQLLPGNAIQGSLETLGGAPAAAAGGQPQANGALPSEINLASRLTMKLKLFLKDDGPLALVSKGLWAFGYGYLLPPIGQWAAKKCRKIDNYLMGGVYEKRSFDKSEFNPAGVTFDQVIGNEDAKAYGRLLCEYLRCPETFDRSKITPSTGILLFGDTRTGKSYFISALCGEIERTLGSTGKFKYFNVPFSAIIADEGINRIMEGARANAPCIVVIEEIDLLSLQRTGNTKILSSFMTTMSSCLQENILDKTVIVIATTNKLQNLEPALLTEGRFGKHIFFDYPCFEDRKVFIGNYLQKTACIITNFDIDRLARMTEGCSYERLALFIKSAFIDAKFKHSVVTQETLEANIYDKILGISKQPVALSKEQQDIVSTHLAGEAVASLLLKSALQVSTVTLRSVSAPVKEEFVGEDLYRRSQGKDKPKQRPFEYGKMFANKESGVYDIETKVEKLNQCKIKLAGHAAEKVLLGDTGLGYHIHDREEALALAQLIVNDGMELEALPKSTRDEYRDLAFALFKKCEADAIALLTEHKKEVEDVARALREKTTLDIRDLRAIIFGEEIKPAAQQNLDFLTKYAALEVPNIDDLLTDETTEPATAAAQ